MAGVCFQFLAHSGAFFHFILINLQFTQQSVHTSVRMYDCVIPRIYINKIMAIENRLARCFFRSFSIEINILELQMKSKYAKYSNLKKQNGHESLKSDEMSCRLYEAGKCLLTSNAGSFRNLENATAR